MVEFRPVPADRFDEYQAILRHAFEPEEGPGGDTEERREAVEGNERRDGEEGDGEGESEGESETESDEWPPALYEPRGLFDDEDRLVSVCKLYYLEAYLGEGFATIGGLGGVATPPEHRRRGHVRRLLRDALEEYREAGVDLVTLWPFSVPFYRGLGWGIANKYTMYELPPDQLAFARDADGRIRRLGADDWKRLRRVEVAFGEGTVLSLRRSERWWRDRTLSAWSGRGEPYVYGYERDGELRGYVLYTVERTDDGPRRLRVMDLAHADDDAYRRLLGFLSDHDSQVDAVRLPRAEETELLERVRDPGEVDCTVKTGPMVRLTDVASILQSRRWPDGLETRFALEVDDPLLEENDRTFVVRVADGGATVEAFDAAAEGGIDVSIDVSTLSRLCVGSVGVDGAERVGGFTIRDGDLREPFRETFPRRTVCLREFF